MNVISSQNDTIFTSPLNSPHSKSIYKEKRSFFHSSKFSQLQNLNPQNDYYAAVQFANFIGLSPINKIKQRHLSNVQRFLQTNMFSNIKSIHQTPNKNLNNKQIKSLSAKNIIKSDHSNRKINFFDLKYLFQSRNNSLKFHKSKQIFERKALFLKTQIQNKQSRILSARSVRQKSFSLNNQTSSNQSQVYSSQRQRAQISNEISRKQQQNAKKYQQTKIFIKRLQQQKQIRSKILQDISKNQIFSQVNNQEQNFNQQNNPMRQNNLLENQQQKFKQDKKFQKYINQKSIDNKEQKVKKLKINKIQKKKIDNMKIQKQEKQSNMKKISIKLNFDKQKTISNQQRNSKQHNKNLNLRFKKQNNRFQFSFI